MKVAVVYHQFPHYRAPVIRALALTGRHQYALWASTDDFHGIKAYKGEAYIPINPLQVGATPRGFRIQGYMGLLRDASIDAFIVLGNPNIAATWIVAAWARLSGRKVLYWSHGWLRREGPVKSLIRNSYFRLAHRVLVYGERGRRIGIESGFPSHRIDVIYNSLDYDSASAVLRAIGSEPNRRRTQSLFKNSGRPLIVCTARLTNLCRFDLLLEAAHELELRGLPINIILVGDGPARAELELLAKDLGLDVIFYGPCYDEDVLGRLIFDADATVYPGKIGLSAIHSLMYGTPTFSHSEMNLQMPEAEAIIPGETGDLFRFGDSIDLASTLQRWIGKAKDRSMTRRACYSVVANCWNPRIQCMLIEEAIDRCFGEAE